MPEVLSEYEPLDPWWTLQQLSLGDWLPVPNFRSYVEADAQAEAQKQARIQNTSYRLVFNADASTATVGVQYDPPTTWYIVEKESSPDSWQPVNNPVTSNQKWWSLDDAQAKAQSVARAEQVRTRVSST